MAAVREVAAVNGAPWAIRVSAEIVGAAGGNCGHALKMGGYGRWIEAIAGGGRDAQGNPVRFAPVP